jgi:hypothetical protein
MHELVELSINTGPSMSEGLQTLRKLSDEITDHPITRGGFPDQLSELLGLSMDGCERQGWSLKSETLNRFPESR